MFEPLNLVIAINHSSISTDKYIFIVYHGRGVLCAIYVEFIAYPSFKGGILIEMLDLVDVGWLN